MAALRTDTRGIVRVRGAGVSAHLPTGCVYRNVVNITQVCATSTSLRIAGQGGVASAIAPVAFHGGRGARGGAKQKGPAMRRAFKEFGCGGRI